MEFGADRLSASIESIMTRFGAMLRSAGSRRGLTDADLDELLQEVRIRLWNARRGGREIEDLGSSYLYQVATTAALDLIRRRRARAGDRTDDLEERTELRSPGPTPDDDLEARELADRIDEAVETLPQDRRVAVRFHLAGYDRDDIARALGWSEARTRNLVYRGLDDLRRRLVLMGVTPARAR